MRAQTRGLSEDTSAVPHITEIEGGWLKGYYRCAKGHEWTCHYSLNPYGWGVYGDIDDFAHLARYQKD